MGEGLESRAGTRREPLGGRNKALVTDPFDEVREIAGAGFERAAAESAKTLDELRPGPLAGTQLHRLGAGRGGRGIEGRVDPDFHALVEHGPSIGAGRGRDGNLGGGNVAAGGSAGAQGSSSHQGHG